MNNDMELACDLYDMTVSKLNSMREKFQRNGREIPNNDIDLFDKLTHSFKSLKTAIAMMESESEGNYPEYSKNYYSQGNSYRNNSNQNRYGSMRQSRTDGLHEMLDGLTEDKRMKVQRYIEDLERR